MSSLGKELLQFAASPLLALALSETFLRLSILALLLLLGLAREEVSVVLLLCPLSCGAPLVIFRRRGSLFVHFIHRIA